MAVSFENTQNIVTFAQDMDAKTINIVAGKDPQNPREGAFVSFGKGVTARLAKDVHKLNAELSISWFIPEDGEPSWMVHRTGESSRDTLDSFSI